MKSIKSLVTFFAFAIIVASCNKNNNNNTPAAPAPNPTPITSNPVFYGHLYSQIMAGNTFSNLFSNHYAYFFKNPVTSGMISPSTTVGAGTVSLNGIQFKYITSPSLIGYNDTTLTYINGPTNWICSGSGTVPAFSFTDNNSWPTFSGPSNLNDTIKLNQTNIIPLQGITNADSVDVWLCDSIKCVRKAVSGSMTSIGFNSSELSTLYSCRSASVSIIIIKKNIATISGVPMCFVKAYRYDKKNLIIK